MHKTLNDHQDYSQKDSNSISVSPQFKSATDLHVNSPFLLKKGKPVSYVNYDIDKQSKDSTNPDIGADEFNNDSSLSSIAFFYNYLWRQPHIKLS